MAILNAIFALFIIFFPIAEIGRIQFSNGVSFSINDILLLSLIAAWSFNKFKNHKINKRKSYHLKKPILLFTAICILSLLLNFRGLGLEKSFVSFLYLLRFVLYFSIYFIVIDLNPRIKKLIPHLLLISGSLVVLLGYIQYYFYPSLRNLFYLGWDEHLYRMFSSFFDPNFAGAFFVLFFFLCLYQIEQFHQNKMRISFLMAIIVSIFTVVAIYLTYSRSALVMLTVAVVSYLMLINKKRLIIISIFFMIVFVFAAPKSFQTEGTDLLRTVSTEARLQSAEQGLSIFEKNPVLGVGFNAYRYALNRYEGLNTQYWQTTHSGAGTDNSFIFVLATTGIFGLLAYLYLLYKIFQLGIINIKKNKHYAILLIVSVVGIGVDSMFINSLFYVFIMEWLWILAGLTENS